MRIIRLYFIKILKKLKILKYFNFNIHKIINRNKVKIPFINGIGLSNLVLEHNWLDSLITHFVSENDSVFVDVGVNIGQSLIRLKTLKPSVPYLGFEPNSSCCSYSKQLSECNNFTDTLIINCALSDSLSTMILEKDSITDPRASVVSMLRPDFLKNKEFILALGYDQIFFEQKISFIKIDVEGAELEVLLGMKKSLKKYQPIIVCEVLDSYSTSVLKFTQNRATEVSKYLHSLGYSIFRIETDAVNNMIVSIQKIESIVITQWTKRSSELNDYLFIPSANEREILEELKKSFPENTN